MPKKQSAKMLLAGVELYFDDLDAARRFYRDTLGLPIADETPGHFTQFNAGSAFLCLERKGAENYPSRDKAVVFFEVPDLSRAIVKIGAGRVVKSHLTGSAGRQHWAVLHDPEGHNILLLESKKPRRKKSRPKKSRARRPRSRRAR
jgi:catechol 2,3-dioxygenase-like lactoylglutathione lyase family enzyme